MSASGEKKPLITGVTDNAGATQDGNYMGNPRPRPAGLDKIPPEKSVEEEEEESKNSTLLIAFLLMLFFQLGNRIFGRLVTFPMHNYPLFMNILCVFVYIPICFLYIVPVTYYGWTTLISKEQQEIPKYKFAVMGAYDSLAGIMQTFAVNYISNASTIVLVQQSAIPISMAISKYTLDAKYTMAQYIGSGIVLLGIFVVLCPTLTAGGGDESAAASSSGGSAPASDSQQLMWIFILVVSCVPMCLSSVYKEKALGEVDIDVVYLNGWVAIYQFLIALPLCIPSAQVINISIDQILPNIWGGMLCWAGINSVTTPSPGMDWVDDCSTAPLYVTTYLLFNVVFNILIVVILKHGSANIMWMASTVIVPLSNVAFSLDCMPGHKPLTSFDIAGLVVIMMGLVEYRFSANLATLWYRIIGDTAQLAADEEEEKKAQMVGRKSERKQARYLGLNQIEAVEGVIDSRVMRDQRAALFRSPKQIRGNFLLSLGIPPSPKLQYLMDEEDGGKTGAGVQMQPLTKGSKMPSFIAISKGIRTNSFVAKSYLQGNVLDRDSEAPAVTRARRTSVSQNDLEALLQPEAKERGRKEEEEEEEEDKARESDEVVFLDEEGLHL